MIRTKRIVIAAGVAVAAAATTGQAVAAQPTDAPAPFATPTTVASGGFVMPADYVALVDDTGLLTIAVPNTWTDVDTAPVITDDGTSLPRITAATDYQVFHDTFDAPGVEYLSLPFNPDPQALMDQFGLEAGCQNTEVLPYDDGAFAGLHGVWTDCGQTGTPEWHQVIASPADQSRTLLLQLQITGPEEAQVLENVLASFNLAAGGTTPTPTAAVSTVPVPTVAVPTVPASTAAVPTIPVPTVAVSTVPALSVPPTTAGGASVPASTVAGPTVPASTVAGSTVPAGPTVPVSVPAGFTQLVDDTGAITMVVPSTWVDVDTAPLTGDDGTGAAPYISAATDFQVFNDTFDAPGAVLVGLPFNPDQQSLMDEFGLTGGCQSTDVQPFTRGDLVGLHGIWSDCGQTGTPVWHQIVASPADQSITLVLQVQITGPAEQQALDTALNTFGLTGSAPAPTPTVAVTTVPGPATTLAAG